MAIPAATVPDAISVAANLARGLGLTVEKPVPLRSTNNAVAWLYPSDVVAKVSMRHNSRLHTELQVARELPALGAPSVSPAPDLPCVVHCRGGLEMTFWQYHAQPPAVVPSYDRVAVALGQLHGALDRLPAGLKASLPSYTEELGGVHSLLADRAAITAADRDLLLRTFHRLQARLDMLVPVDRFVAIHGAPHPYNVLLVGDEPAFIDFETACRGPVEWDLAHLDAQAEPLFRSSVQVELLWLCRSMASVKAATLCMADVDRGDMREHAEWHLAYLKEHVAPNV
jgi:Phosphotransferase enzyme family